MDTQGRRDEKKVLVVHGYEVFAFGFLGLLAELVCQWVARNHQRYTHIVLVGGWDLRDPGPRQTIAEVMARRLTKLGVPDNKLYHQYSGGLGLGNVLPPRDSMEEVDLLPSIFQALGWGLNTAFDAVAIWFFVPRMGLLYRSRRAQYQKLYSVFHWRTLLMVKRIAIGVVAYFATANDTQGRGELFQGNRRARTLITAEEMERMRVVSPSDWQKEDSK